MHASLVLPQGTRGIGPGRPQRGRESEQNASQYRDRSGEPKDANVGRHMKRERNITEPHDVYKEMTDPESGHQTQRCAHRGERNAFSKQLANEAPTTGPERRSNS